MVNKVTLMGHLGADPETRTTATGLVVATLRLATSFKSKDEEKTEWHRVVCFGKLAEIVAAHMRKGSGLYLEGRIQYRSYENKDGATVWTTEIVAHEVKFLPRGNGGGEGDGAERSGYAKDTVDDDIPF